MSVAQRWTVIGIFEEQEQAKQAMEELLQAGFSRDQIGFVMRGNPLPSNSTEAEPGETASAFTGGVVGGVLGAVDALLTPVLGPSVANTIPTSGISLAEEAVEKFQHAGADDEGKHRTDRADSMDTPNTLEHDQLETVNAADRVPDESGVGANEGEKFTSADELRLHTDEATGAITGGVIGGVLGASVALLIPVIGPAFAGGILVAAFSAALGAVTGSFLGAFVGMGVSEEHARQYEHEFKAGRTIVTVTTDDRQQDVLDIFYRHGARYANAHDRT
jgi:gas vesicle protein